MNLVYVYLGVIFLVGYLIGNINFARIICYRSSKKDITTMGSKNPGTMNMIRTRGVKEGFLTLVSEAMKSGVPALVSYFIFLTYFPGYEHLAYFVSAVGSLIGYCYPVAYKFKGGKGIACMFGIFAFNPIMWWITLVTFAVCFVIFLYVDYPFIVTFIFIYSLASVTTAFYWFMPGLNFVITISIITILWIAGALILFKHRGNIKRLLTGTENKVKFIDKLRKKKPEEAQVEVAAEEKEEVKKVEKPKAPSAKKTVSKPAAKKTEEKTVAKKSTTAKTSEKPAAKKTAAKK